MESYGNSAETRPRGGGCDEEKEVVLARICGTWLASGPVAPEVADYMMHTLRRENVITFACCEEEYREKGLPRSYNSEEYFPAWKPEWLSTGNRRTGGKQDDIVNLNGGDRPDQNGCCSSVLEPRAYCLGCRREILTESGHLCQLCQALANDR